MMWRRSPDAFWRAAPGFLVLGDIHGSTLDVTAPGDVVWALLEEAIDEDSLAEQLAESFSADPAQVRADVSKLLQDLLKVGHVQHID